MDLNEQRLEYAWKWFNFHADQRTKMFNFMLLGLGLLASALVTALDRHYFDLARALGIAAFLISLAFWRIDQRNKQLYEAALDVLFLLEQDHLFSRHDKFSPQLDGNAVPYAISWRIHQDDRRNGKTPHLLRQLVQGRHRVLMPAVILVLGGMFLFVGLDIFDWTKRDDPVQRLELVIPPANAVKAPTPETPVASTPRVDPMTPSGDDTVSVLQQSLPVAVVPQARNWGWLALLPGLGLIAWGVVSAIGGRRKQSVMQLLAGALLSATGLISISLKGEVKLNPEFELRLLDKLDSRIRVQIGSLGVLPRFLGSRRFEGFASGEATLKCAEGSALHADARAFGQLIRMAQASDEVVVLAVGGTDRDPLGSALKRQRESNSGLARARVAAALECAGLPDASGADSALHIVPLVTGPAYTPERDLSGEAAAAAMHVDRAVELYVLAIPRAPAKK